MPGGDAIAAKVGRSGTVSKGDGGGSNFVRAKCNQMCFWIWVAAAAVAAPRVKAGPSNVGQGVRILEDWVASGLNCRFLSPGVQML